MIGGAIDLIVRPPAHEAPRGWSFSFAFALLGFMLGLVNGKEPRSQILVRRRLARHRTDLLVRPLDHLQAVPILICSIRPEQLDP